MVEAPSASVDVAGGFRAYDLSMSADSAGGAAPPLGFSSSEQWIDPIVGARVSAPLSGRWYASGYGDLGGFGIGDASNLNWQVTGTVGYRFNERWSMLAGYRHFRVDKTLNGRDMTLELSGPVIGLNARL